MIPQNPQNMAFPGMQLNTTGGGHELPPPPGGIEGTAPPANPFANMFTGAGSDPQNQMDLQMTNQFQQQDRDRLGGAPGSAFGGQMSGYADQIYNESLRRLNPEWETRAREFEQSLVGRGIDPNSEAGQQARAQFEANRADAFSSARRQADQGALGYQNQMWSQQFAQDQERNAARRAMLQNAAAGQNRADDLRFRERAFNEDTRRWDQNFDFGMGQNDFNQLLQLMNFDRDTAGFNNQASMQELTSILPFLNLIPGGGPAGIDVMSPYMSQQNQANSNYQTSNANRNANMQAAASIAMMMMLSDERAKTEIRQVGTLHNGLPVYAYRYITGGPTHIGVMAQDVEQVKPEAVVEVGGLKLVNYDLAVA